MSRTRIVGGNITKITGGKYKIFAKDNIEFHSNKQVIQNAKEGIFYGEPKKPTEQELKPKKIIFKPNKISPQTNIISVIEKLDEPIKPKDVISFSGKIIADNWVSLNGKLYLIPKNIVLFGTTFFKINEDLYQSIEQISNCECLQDYKNSINEQLNILKDFLKEIDVSNMKYKKHIKDRLEYDSYYRLITSIEEIEKKFSNTIDESNAKKWIIETLEN